MNATVLILHRDGMGEAPPELRRKLVAIYLRLLIENDTPPAAICCYAEGVLLAVTGSPVLDELRALEARGTRLILCQTCLNHYGVGADVQVGIVGGMADILAAQDSAAKVITL